MYAKQIILCSIVIANAKHCGTNFSIETQNMWQWKQRTLYEHLLFLYLDLTQSSWLATDNVTNIFLLFNFYEANFIRLSCEVPCHRFKSYGSVICYQKTITQVNHLRSGNTTLVVFSLEHCTVRARMWIRHRTKRSVSPALHCIWHLRSMTAQLIGSSAIVASLRPNEWPLHLAVITTQIKKVTFVAIQSTLWSAHNPVIANRACFIGYVLQWAFRCCDSC